MATGMFGANVEALMDIARNFDGSSEVPKSASGKVRSGIANVEWVGTDAERYRSTWGESLPNELRDLADLTWDYSDELERQAQDQEDASRGDDSGGCLEATGDFLGGLVGGLFVDGIWGDIKGILGLLGFGFEPFSWSLDNLGENWGGLLEGAAGLIGIDMTGQGRGFLETLGDSWGGLVSDFFAVDMWGDDPGRALGNVLWNVGSMLIPGYNVVKLLRMLDTPDAPNMPDADAPNTRGDAPDGHRSDSDSDSDSDGDGRDSDSDRDSESNNSDGNANSPSSNDPPPYGSDADGRISDRDGTPLNQHETRSPGHSDLNRDVTDRNSNFDSDTVYRTDDGQTFVTNANGQVEYSSITRTGDELTGSDRSGMGAASRDYWDHDAGDQRGHHNPAFMGGTNDNVNLTQQSPGANAGEGRGQNSPSPEAHQNALEQRTQQYMQQNPSEPVTWERHTVYDDNGHATGYNVRVTDGDGSPIDLSQQGADQPHLAPNDDGWVHIRD